MTSPAEPTRIMGSCDILLSMEFRGKGDPRVYWILNILLSLMFAWFILWGLEFLADFEWDVITLVLFTFIIAVIAHLFAGRRTTTHIPDDE